MRYSSIIYVLILSSLLYVNLAIAQLYGETAFYNPVEHLGMLLFCITSFFSARATIRLKRYQHSTNFYQYLQALLLSGILGTLLNIGIWLLLRFIYLTVIKESHWQVSWIAVFAQMAFIFIYIHLVIASGYLAYYYLSQANQAKLNRALAEQASSQAQLKLLQQQLTPHFLFNNLNALSSLISFAPERAELYVTKLANLYRYMLKHKESHLVAVCEEMAFMHDYLDLMNIRFDDAYALNIKSDMEPHQHQLIVAGSLQTLIENAIKHNTASCDTPLQIELFIAQQQMTMINKKTLKPGKVPSTKTGLSNLQQRYQSLTNRNVSIEESDGFFSVSLPLLAQGTV